MRCRHLFSTASLLGLILVMAGAPHAQNQLPPPGGFPPFTLDLDAMFRERPILAQFDASKNGRLDSAERKAAREWLESAPLPPISSRVMLAGDSPPDDQLHAAVETAGASVVKELTESPIAGELGRQDPLSAIAGEFQRRESPALSMRSNARWLTDQALEHRADAVLVWLSEHDEALPWEIVRQMQALRAAGIPALLLARQPWRVSAAVLAQVTQFVRSPREFR